LVEVRNPTGKHYYDGSLIEKLAWLAPPLEL
jgi:hypothetical protein